MATPFAITAASPPEDTCFTTPAALISLLPQLLQITANPADFTLPVGSTTPGPDQQSLPWINTTDGRVYTFQSGEWRSPHWQQPGQMQWYVDPATGLPADPSAFIDTYDGGSAGTVTISGGPFWAVAPADYNGRWLANLARAGSAGDPNNLFFPVGKSGPITTPAEGADAVAAGLSGATIPGAAGTYNLSYYNRYMVGCLIYRTARQFYSIPGA